MSLEANYQMKTVELVCVPPISLCVHSGCQQVVATNNQAVVKAVVIMADQIFDGESFLAYVVGGCGWCAVT